MKFAKILSVCLLVAMLATSFTCFAYNLTDYDNFTGGVGRMVMKNGSPTVDGNISDGEGYGQAVTIDYTNSVSIWGPSSRVITSITTSFAWDDNGLYIGADIVDPSMVQSSGEDDIDMSDDGTNQYGYNGDVFIFGIDPADEFYNNGFLKDRTTWYCVSISDAGTFECYRTQSDEGDITADVKGSASLTGAGWKFEMMLPWDQIITDAESASLGDVAVTKAKIVENGTISRCMVMYMDRAPYNADFSVFASAAVQAKEGEIFTLSRNMTIPTTLRDGTNGHMNAGESVSCYGIELAAGDASGNAIETTAPETTAPETTALETTTAAETTQKEEETKSNLIDDTTKAPEDKKEDTKDEEKGGSSALPIILCIVGVVVVAAVVVAAVVVVVVVLKKKKK